MVNFLLLFYQEYSSVTYSRAKPERSDKYTNIDDGHVTFVVMTIFDVKCPHISDISFAGGL